MQQQRIVSHCIYCYLLLCLKYVFKTSNRQLNGHLFQVDKMYLIIASLAIEEMTLLSGCVRNKHTIEPFIHEN